MSKKSPNYLEVTGAEATAAAIAMALTGLASAPDALPRESAEAARVAHARIKDPRTTSVVRPTDPLRVFGKFNSPGHFGTPGGHGAREARRRRRQLGLSDPS